MIFGSSSDPVLIKKIAIKIWLLREEIHSVTKSSYDQFEDKNKLKTILMDEYGNPINNASLQLVPENEESKDKNEEVQNETEAASLKIIQRGSENIHQDKVFNGVVVLSEIDMSKIHFFCSRNFSIGQTIVIEFQIPNKFSITSEIIYSHSFNMRNNIIGKNKHSFRIVANYSFLKKGERTLLRDFISSIEPEVPKPVKASNETTTSNDNFDELDGLDL